MKSFSLARPPRAARSEPITVRPSESAWCREGAPPQLPGCQWASPSGGSCSWPGLQARARPSRSSESLVRVGSHPGHKRGHDTRTAAGVSPVHGTTAAAGTGPYRRSTGGAGRPAAGGGGGRYTVNAAAAARCVWGEPADRCGAATALPGPGPWRRRTLPMGHRDGWSRAGVPVGRIVPGAPAIGTWPPIGPSRGPCVCGEG